MHNPNVRQRIDAIDYLFAQIAIPDNKFEPQLNYFLLVAIYGAAQYCVKTLFLDSIDKGMDQANLANLDEKINSLIQTPGLTNIRDLFLISNREIDIGNFALYNGLIKKRNEFAHGKTDPTKLDGVTLSELQKAFSQLKDLLNLIEKTLDLSCTIKLC